MTDLRPSGLPFPASPPENRDELPERGQPGAPAGWGMRGLARLIDFLIFWVASGWLVAALGTRFDQRTGDLVEGSALTLLIFPIAFIVYETVLISRTGQTLGKYLCQVKAVNWYDGSLVDVRSAFVRAIVPGVFLLLSSLALVVGVPWLGVLFYVPPIIYLSSVANVVYRGPHDKAAGTIVLAAPRYRRT